jgi:hypothetical protein
MKDLKPKEAEHATPTGYEVGYGKPPKKGQFQKGVSGNPKGRPKGAGDICAAVLRELNTRITITENGRKIRLSKQDVVAKQAVNGAMKGNPYHLRFIRDTAQQAADKNALMEEKRTREASLERSKNYKAMSTAQLEALLAQQLEAAGWNNED